MGTEYNIMVMILILIYLPGMLTATYSWVSDKVLSTYEEILGAQKCLSMDKNCRCTVQGAEKWSVVLN